MRCRACRPASCTRSRCATDTGRATARAASSRSIAMSHAGARSLTGVAAAALCAAAVAADLGMRIESCVSASAIQFDPVDQRVALDADDQARVQAEMEQRYPVLAQHGFPVSKIVLWHKKSGESIFITLLEHPTKADEACFTATFTAARFAGIETLRRKYLRPELQI